MKKLLLTIPAASLLALAILLLPGAQRAVHQAERAAAQTGAQTVSSWTEPVNLSHSGAATNPNVVVDVDGVVHAIWEDEFAGLEYSHSEEDGWSEPTAVVFPFETPQVKFLNDTDGYIHAFWIDERGNLYHSRVAGASFGNPKGWLPRQWLGQSVAAFDAVPGPDKFIFLAYASAYSAGGFPAGVYFMSSKDGGQNWRDQEPVYQSMYFRSVTEENANVSIAAAASGEQQRIYVAWDNRARKQVLYAASPDGGATWGDAVEVDGPGAIQGGASPLDIRVTANGEEALLLWQRGQAGASCTQYYQWTGIGGEAWTEPQSMLEDLQGCYQGAKFMAGPRGSTLLSLEIQDQVILVAWNGSQWSLPQAQTDLLGFDDPEINSSVVFRCRQSAWSDAYHLYYVGCDTAGGGDVWETNRLVDLTEDWYQDRVVWTPPGVVDASSTDMQDLALAASQNGWMHALWSQVEEGSGDAATSALFYSRRDDERWSRPVAVLRLPEGSAVQPSVAVDAGGRLLVAWSAAPMGGVFFSAADAERASTLSEWLEPAALPSPAPAASSPVVLAGQDETVYVAYSIPFNEGRGIYLTLSTDGGKTWEEPIKAFDGASTGWEIVDQPRLARSEDGRLHLLWTRYTLTGGRIPLSLYYAHSDDEGKTWSAPEAVVERGVIQSQIFTATPSLVHRVWTESNAGRSLVWHQYSTDNGQTWSRPSSIISLGKALAPASVAQDRAGQLHLLQLIRDSAGKILLKHWQWNGTSWQVQEDEEVGSGAELQISALTGAVSPTGDLGVLYLGAVQVGQSDQTQNNIFFTKRQVELPAGLPTPLPPSVRPTETPGPTPTEAPDPTVTPDLASIQSGDLSGGAGPAGSSWIGLILGTGLATVIAAGVFSLRVWMMRRNR